MRTLEQDAARLREAAKWISLYVDKLTTDTKRWDEAFPSGHGLHADTSTYERLFVHPGVGLAMAGLLVSMAETLEMGLLRDRATWEMADLLADQILGKPNGTTTEQERV